MSPRHIALAVLVALIWGVNFALIRIGLASFPPLFLGALRFGIAALPALLLPRPSIAWPLLVGIGMTLFVGQFALLFPGMALGMPPGLASVTLQIQAFFTILIGAAVLRELPGPHQVAGSVLACLGLIVIALTAGGSDATLTGFVMTVGAATSWAVGNVILRRAGKVDTFATMAWLSLVAPLPLLALSLVIDGPRADAEALMHLSWVGLGALLYIAVLSTTVGFAAWGHLLKLYPAGTVAPFSLLVPIFGTFTAYLVFDERFGPLRLAGMGLVLAGLALVVAPRRQRAGKRETRLVSIDDLASGWIAYWTDPAGISDKNPWHWASERADELIRSDLDAGFEFILTVLQSAANDSRLLAVLAAGPLEDIIADHGPEIIARVEEEARRSPEFRNLLGGVWQRGMSEEIWKRVLKAAPTRW